MVFESKEQLGEEILALLEALRRLSDGRYACVVEPGRLLFECGTPDEPGWPLRQLFERRSGELFELPQRMAEGAALDDMFAGWDEDEFLLAFLNGRVAVALVCPEAEPVRAEAEKPLRALADRLLRFDERWRLDAQGRGLFFGQPRLDLIVVGRAAG
jgi:hypothetical protein